MNINEIAQMAGVSRATVSRYLNNGYVSREKREKIRAVIASTGYVPSAYAQTLRTNRTGTVGVIVPKISSESIGRMVDGATMVLAEQGCHPLLGNTDQNRDRELEYMTLFQNRQVDGILLIATVLTPRHAKAIRALSTPLVVLGQETGLCGCVCYDDFGAAKSLTDAMLESGRRRVGYIGVTREDRAAGESRFQGYCAALEARGLPLRQELVLEGPFKAESGRENAALLLEREPGLDAIFCATDNIAAGAIACLRERGMLPPRVAVCGVGDSEMARLLSPSLTSAHLHYKTGGAEAARMLLEQMERGGGVSKCVRLGCTVANRESTCVSRSTESAVQEKSG